MKHKEVNSSNIFSIGYSSGVMEITFRKKKDGTKGSTYRYEPVTHEGHKAIMEAESHGEFFAKHIKNNPMISCEKVS